ncbi:MAG: hypothetical protein JM58_00385 [Peptococcaceae bacterium BICA1-8]|nr:MAG: hypothetical protein JM58_00385 [Peptococcaceae bacterium BICA1-8]
MTYDLYDTPLYRPPSEANSLILQLTLGCSHNKCTFCNMYKAKKYREKSTEEIKEHINWAKQNCPQANKIFLADGNVLAMETEKLLAIIDNLYRQFPKLRSVSCYAGPRDILAKNEDQLLALKDAGLRILYLGVESGSSEILRNVNKGVSADQMIEAGQKVKKCGIKLSCMIISGLGGQSLWEAHAVESAKVINSISPRFLSLLTLYIDEGTVLEKEIDAGNFKLLSPRQVLEETKLMLENLQVNNCIFRSNHASNYIALEGILNKDKAKLIKQVNAALNSKEFKEGQH